MDSKTERFKKVAVNRTNSILKELRLLSNCSNKNNYNYSDVDVKKIFNAIDEELRACKAKFKSEKNKNKEFKL